MSGMNGYRQTAPRRSDVAAHPSSHPFPLRAFCSPPWPSRMAGTRGTHPTRVKTRMSLPQPISFGTNSSWITARLLFGLGAPPVKGGNPRADQDTGTILPLVPDPAPVSRAASPCAPERWRSHRRHSPDRGCQYSGQDHTDADRSDDGGKTSRDSGHAPGLSEGSVLELPPERGLHGSSHRRYVPQAEQ